MRSAAELAPLKKMPSMVIERTSAAGAPPAAGAPAARNMTPAELVRVMIVPARDQVTLIYLLQNSVRRVPLGVPHPAKLTPNWQGHSVGRYEGDTLVIDTVGIKVAPISTVDAFGTPHSDALHVVERFRLIDGEAAAEAQRKNGATYRAFPPYGRGTVDPDTTKKGLQVAFTVEDPGVFTMPWSGQVTYRRLIGAWPEAICAENPSFFGSDGGIPRAHVPDF